MGLHGVPLLLCRTAAAAAAKGTEERKTTKRERWGGRFSGCWMPPVGYGEEGRSSHRDRHGDTTANNRWAFAAGPTAASLFGRIREGITIVAVARLRAFQTSL